MLYIQLILSEVCGVALHPGPSLPPADTFSSLLQTFDSSLVLEQEAPDRLKNILSKCVCVCVLSDRLNLGGRGLSP